MKKNTSTLSIRLQLPEEEAERPLPQDEVTYLWDRIIFAILVVVGLFFAATAGIWHWLKDPQLDPSVTGAPPAIAIEASDRTAEAPDKTAEAPDKTAEAPPKTTEVLLKTAETSYKRAEAPALVAAMPTNRVDEAQFKEAQIQPSQQISPNSKPIATSSSQQPHASTATPQPQSVSASSAGKPVQPINSTDSSVSEIPADAAARSQSPLAKVQVLSDRLVHAQLSNAMHRGKPADRAAAIIPMNKEGLIKVYFFAEFEHLKGQTVYYDWFLKGKRMARVRTQPQANLVSAHSSKYIDRYMLGQWHVEVRTAAGDTLARAEFEVR